MDGVCSWGLGAHIYLDGKPVDTQKIPQYSTLIMFQSTGFNFSGLFAARVVLGIFEAGFGPAIPLYFCMSTSPNI